MTAAAADRTSRARAGAGTVLAAAAALGLYTAQSHAGLHENGPVLVELWRRGAVVHGHALVLPLARLVAAVGLAGEPAQADLAIRLVSAGAAALLVGLVAWRGVRRAGLLAGLLLALVVGLAPSLRFFAGAVETRALAAGGAALAVVLAGRTTRSLTHGLLLTALGGALACAGHASLVVILPGLLLLRLAAEARAGRAAGVREAAAVAGALLTAAALTAGAVLAIDRLWNPRDPTGGTFMLDYLRNAAGWAETVGRPALSAWFAAEALGPLGALVPLAAIGVLPMARASPREAASHVLVVVGLLAAGWAVGARQYGGYLLPAAASLAFLAAEGVAHVRRAERALPAVLGLASLVLLACGLANLMAEAARPGLVTPSGTIWRQDPAQLALPWTGPMPGVLGQVPVAAWLIGSVGVALLAGALRGTRGPRLPAAALVLLLTAGAFQLTAGERFRGCWPRLWNQEVRDWAQAARRDLGEGDLLLAAAPSPQVAWTITYYGPRWIDLSDAVRVAGPKAAAHWLEERDAVVAETLQRGGRIVLAEESLALLVGGQRPDHALAALERWRGTTHVWRWSLVRGLRP